MQLAGRLSPAQFEPHCAAQRAPKLARAPSRASPRKWRGRKPSLRVCAPVCAAAGRPQAPVSDRGASGLDVQGFSPTSRAAWKIVSDTLRQQLVLHKVRMISAQELFFPANREVPVIDIRPPREFEAAHIPGSINIPLYRSITGWDPRRVARRLVFAVFGMFHGTESNPFFFEDIMRKVDNEVGIILVCNNGGSLDPTLDDRMGTQSRSLMAAYEALQLGADKIRVLKGGFSRWRKTGRAYINKDGIEVKDQGVEV